MEQQHGLDKLSEPIFTRKKALLTVGQYAVRQGVSTGIVEECTRLGVVQIRKHKDKTFIVDLPLDTYKILKQQDPPSSDVIDSTLCANKISELVNRIFKPQTDAKAIPAAVKKNEDSKNSSEIKSFPADLSSPAIPDLQLFADEENRTANDKDKNELQTGGFRVPAIRSVTDSLRAISIWKVSFAFAAAACVISFCAYTWVSIDRKNQQQKLQQAYDSIGKLMSKYEVTRQQARVTEFDMMSWRSEAEQAKGALINTESELQNTRRSLSETKKTLQSMQEYNNEKLKELNEQVSNIREHIPNSARQSTE